MSAVTLSSDDVDKELYQKICEMAAEQNLPVQTLQRNILFDIFNIPKNHNTRTQHQLLHQALCKISAFEGITVRNVIRNCLRKYFGMTVEPTQSKMFLKPKDKRFQILSFLMTVDAATRYEIAEKCEIPALILNKNPWLFEQFRVSYDKRVWWRVTERGRQEYRRFVAKQVVASEITESRRQKEQKAAKKIAKKAEEAKLTEYFIREKAFLANESGLRRYFQYDENDPIDMEIVKRFHEHSTSVRREFYCPSEEYFCRQILCKRLSLRCNAKYLNVDQVIETKLLEWCKKKGKTRTELVRELFCVEFNIKKSEVKPPH